MASLRLRCSHSFLRDYQEYVIGFDAGSWQPRPNISAPHFVESEVDVAPLRDIL